MDRDGIGSSGLHPLGGSQRLLRDWPQLQAAATVSTLRLRWHPLDPDRLEASVTVSTIRSRWHR
ncbi:MAG: hypothetical protein AAFR61_07500 [Bacteroidota bacterium]